METLTIQSGVDELIRRSLTDPDDLAFFYCHAPAGRPVSLPVLIKVAGKPVAWRDTGKLPASANDRPPGAVPGLVKVSVPEARRLLRLATEPMTCVARDLGHAWSRWRRRHQARARWHHYHARLKTERGFGGARGTQA